MIAAKLAGSDGSFVKRLTVRAQVLAKAAAENRLRERRADPWRWRSPHLLWPLFAKERK